VRQDNDLAKCHELSPVHKPQEGLVTTATLAESSCLL
jgi:hypothetical protein